MNNLGRAGIGRRVFIGGAAGLGLATCARLPWEPGVRRIGWLTITDSILLDGPARVFRSRLAELGYVEGKDYTLETRVADGDAAKLPGLAAELVQLKADVIVAQSQAAALAAQQATSSIPIVFFGVTDPVGLKLVASLARPGANVTGYSDVGRAVFPKMLQWLKEIAPGVTRPGVLWNGGNAVMVRFWQETREGADALRLELLALEVRTAADIEPALKSAADAHANALVAIGDPLLTRGQQKILEFAADRRLPLISQQRQWTDQGALLSYGDFGPFRRAADFVDKILKGAKPADIPVEQPMSLELVVNLKSARALGLTVPQSVLTFATDVIQ